jgi:predicted permease
MGWIRRLGSTLRFSRRADELDEELRFHLDERTEANIRLGMTPEEARRAALRRFGNLTLTKEHTRDADTLRWLDDARRDLKHAWRLLQRNPLFTATAVMSLAIGIGANTTVFTVANALLLRPPDGVTDPDRLVDIGTSRAGGGFGPSSYAAFLDVRQQATALDGVYAYSRFPQSLTLGSAGNASAESIFGSLVTNNYFAVLGALPAAGRLFDRTDSEQPLGSPVAVLSYGFWTRRFNRDPAVIGRAVTLNRHLFTVIGVTAEGFHGTGVRALDVWVPIGMAPAVGSGAAAALGDRGNRQWLIGGRLKPGVSIAQAATEIQVIGRALEREGEDPDPNRRTTLSLLPGSPVPGNRGPIVAFLALVVMMVTLVLVIACANVTGVLLSRAAARRHEMALRLAIGAGRERLVRQLLTETILLFMLGGSAGLLLARGMTSGVSALLPALPFPVDLRLALDVRVLGYATVLSLAAAVLSGLAPALQASKADVLSGLRNEPGLVGRLRLRHVFILGQVALSVVLVVCAGLFMRALHRAGSIDPGFDSHGVDLASLGLAQAGYTEETGAIFARELLERVRGLAHVENASLGSGLPGGFEVRRATVTVPSVAPTAGRPFTIDWNIVEPGYFATLRMAIVSGRDFGVGDRHGTQPVAIVSEGAARQFWPGQGAIGKYLLQPLPEPPAKPGQQGLPRSAAPRTQSLLVIAVVRDAQFSSLIDGLSRPSVYVPFQQQYVSQVTVAVRATQGRRVADDLRALLTSMNPNLAIVTAGTLEDSLALGLTPQRIAASVAGSLGLLGVILASIGIYGVTAYTVARRTREIGVRIALGARPADIVRMVLREGVSLTLVGSAIGALLAAALSRVLAGFLFGIPSTDPVTFIGATALFTATALLACYVPVRRATRIDPTQALRYE